MVPTLLMAALLATAPPALPPQAVAPQRALLDRYCVACHTEQAKARGAVPVALDNLDLADIPANAETLEKVVRKMRAGLMPPPGAARPDEAAARRLTSWLETELDRAALAGPNPGRPPIHRLNRVEYGNAVRDLLALAIDPASLLPPD